MTIVLLVEGDTERALKQHLKTFLDNKAIEAGRPRIQLETRKGISNELYRLAKPSRKYVKTEEMYAILAGKDLTVAANQCSEFKAFLNTLLTLSHLSPLP